MHLSAVLEGRRYRKNARIVGLLAHRWLHANVCKASCCSRVSTFACITIVSFLNIGLCINALHVRFSLLQRSVMCMARFEG
jgi:hypothetical protein